MNRRWTLLLPVIFVSYSLSYLDRANFSFGAAAGMAKDLGISPAENSLLGSLFFLGLLGWSRLASATGLITNLTLLYIDRFLLGIVESAVLPAMLILQSRWYTAKERARANAFLVLGNPATMLWMSLVSGWLVAQA